MHRRCCQLVTRSMTRVRCNSPRSCSWSPAGSIVGALYHKQQTQSSAPEDGRNYRPKHVEMIEITNKLLLLHLVDCLDYCNIQIFNLLMSSTRFESKPTWLQSTGWRSCLRHCVTSRKFAGSIPDGVTGNFLWHNPSGRTMNLGLTQPLTKMMGKGGRCVGLTTLRLSFADWREIWEPQTPGTLRACSGL